MSIVWEHEATQPRAWAALLPATLEAVERWATPQGLMLMDVYGPHYHVNVHGPKDDQRRHLVLRPASLKLGALKALQDAPDHWAGWENELDQIFTNVVANKVGQPDNWSLSALDFMLQLAWFREVLYA